MFVHPKAGRSVSAEGPFAPALGCVVGLVGRGAATMHKPLGPQLEKLNERRIYDGLSVACIIFSKSCEGLSLTQSRTLLDCYAPGNGHFVSTFTRLTSLLEHRL